MAWEFGKRGAALVLWDVDEDANRKTAESLTALGVNRRVYLNTVDLRNEDQVKAAVKQVKEKCGGDVTILVMAAAPEAKPMSVLKISRAEIENHFMVSYLSQLWLIQHFLPSMISKNHGNIFLSQ